MMMVLQVLYSATVTDILMIFYNFVINVIYNLNFYGFTEVTVFVLAAATIDVTSQIAVSGQ
jgi:hypothetical protein